MLKKLLIDGVKVALDTELSDSACVNDIVESISNEALFESDGSRQLLSLDHASDRLVQYDLQKAVLAVAGVLGATIPLATSPLGVASAAWRK